MKKIHEDGCGLTIELSDDGEVIVTCTDPTRVGNLSQGRLTILAPTVKLAHVSGTADEEPLMRQIMGVIPLAHPGTDVRVSGSDGKVEVSVWGPRTLKTTTADLAKRLMGALETRRSAK